MPAACFGQPEIPPPSSSPLIQSLIQNDVVLAGQLLSDGADPNAWDVITPLYAAQEYVRSSRKRHAIMKRMISAGAIVDATTADGSTPLMLAASEGDMRSVRYARTLPSWTRARSSARDATQKYCGSG